MIKTGSKLLDDFIEGYKNEITLIYGPAASGKTTLAKLAAIAQAKEGKKVLFIDAEHGFSAERFEQLGGKNLLGSILLLRPKSFLEQDKYIKSLKLIANKFAMVIIDTIGIFYRAELNKDPESINKALNIQLKILTETAKNVPVILTNQVYDRLDGQINTVSGELVKGWSKCILELKKDPRSVLMKKPVQKEIKFEIEEKGFFESNTFKRVM